MHSKKLMRFQEQNWSYDKSKILIKEVIILEDQLQGKQSLWVGLIAFAFGL